MGEVNSKALAVGLAGAKNVAEAACFGGAQGAGLCGVLWERGRVPEVSFRSLNLICGLKAMQGF